jgi:hypothetical protein
MPLGNGIRVRGQIAKSVQPPPPLPRGSMVFALIVSTKSHKTVIVIKVQTYMISNAIQG